MIKPVIKENVGKLEKVLSDFDIVGKVVEINVGPSHLPEYFFRNR